MNQVRWTKAIGSAKTPHYDLSSGQIAQHSGPPTLQSLAGGASPGTTPSSRFPQIIHVPVNAFPCHRPPQVTRKPSRQTTGASGAARVEIPACRELKTTQPSDSDAGG